MPSPAQTILPGYENSRAAVRASKLMMSMIAIAISLSTGHAEAASLPLAVASAINDIGDFCSDSPKNSKPRQSCCQNACIQNIPNMNANGEVGSKEQLHQDWLDACVERCPKR